MSPHRTLFLVLLVAALSAFSTAQDVAWAWIDPVGQGSSFPVTNAYRFQSNGGIPFVIRDPSQQNRFLVHFTSIAPSSGVAHASAYGGNHIAVVNGWTTVGSDVVITVETFTPTGAPANDGKFVVHYRRIGPNDMRSAYLWADQPTNPSYTPLSLTNWNGNRAASTIARTGIGTYSVTLPGLGASLSGELGHVQITPYANDLLRAKAAGWVNVGGNMTVDVRTFDASGPADGRFVLTYHESAAPIDPEIGSGAHCWANDATAAFYVPNPLFTDSNGSFGIRGGEIVERLSLGRYRVNLPNVAPVDRSMAMVTAIGTGSEYATIEGWGTDGHAGTRVYIRTWTAGGSPVDARFAVNYLTNRPVREVAWARVEPSGQGSSFTPEHAHQYNPNGKPIAVTRNGPGNNTFTVHIPGTNEGNGCVTATAYQGNHTVTVLGWGRNGNEVYAVVALFDPSGGPANDAGFTVRYESGGNWDDRHAYLTADNPSAASYTPNTARSWNGQRAAPTITRSGPGFYTVRVPGLAPTGAELGHVQVTAAGTGPARRVSVAGWGPSGSDMLIGVRTFDVTGTLADGAFTLTYHEAAAPIPEQIGSGAHVWADSATAVHYTPNPSYTDSNGTFGPAGAETVDRLGTGFYFVSLPNLAPRESTIALATAYGGNATHASVWNWAPGLAGGTAVWVKTFDASGAPADSRFDLLFLTNRPAVDTPATNSIYGSGCNGPVLTGLTRPIFGHSWDLRLAGIPTGALLGFLQLGFSDPMLSFGAQAPGCSQYTNGLAVALLPLPVSTPAYSLSIPLANSFLGLPIRAQGGALVPGINPFSLAASNGLRGTIGSF